MKFSEKMLLIKQGATLADIKKLEEEEAAEIAEAKKNNPEDKKDNPEDKKDNPDDNKDEILTALEAAKVALEEANKTNESLKRENEALNEKFISLTNKQTVKEEKPYTSAEVFDELFNNHKNTKEES